MDAQIGIKIPEQLINDTIRAELIRQMPNKDAFADAVIKQAMEAKANSYDRETIFQQAVKKMIHDEANKIMREWIDQNRDAFRDTLIKYLTQNRNQHLKTMCAGLAKSIDGYKINVTMNMTDISSRD